MLTVLSYPLAKSAPRLAQEPLGWMCYFGDATLVDFDGLPPTAAPEPMKDWPIEISTPTDPMNAMDRMASRRIDAARRSPCSIANQLSMPNAKAARPSRAAAWVQSQPIVATAPLTKVFAKLRGPGARRSFSTVNHSGSVAGGPARLPGAGGRLSKGALTNQFSTVGFRRNDSTL